MNVRLQTLLLGTGALISLVEIVAAPKDSDPGPWGAAALGIALLRRAIIATPQPTPVVLTGCVLIVLLVAGDRGFVDFHRPVWLAVFLTVGIGYAFWEKIQKLWK